MDSTTKEVQRHSLELLKVFHDICDKNNLQYYMIGGTLLGAVRHGGFIPWDDDIDIAMPRKDYDILINNSDAVFDKKYKLEHYSNSDDLVVNQSMFAMFSNQQVKVFIEKNQEALEKNISIDVFPVDGTPDNLLLRKLFFFKIMFLRALYKFTFSDRLEIEISDKRSIIEKFLIIFAKKTNIGKMINREKTRDKLEAALKKYDVYNCKSMAGTFYGVYKLREFVDSKYFTKRKKYKFEGGEFWGTEFADGYLKSIYGDYMILPPEEKRIGKHKIVKIEELE